MQHLIVSRLGIGIHNEDWLRSALGLFESITFPSLRAQTSQNFISLLIVDHEMPAIARSRLSAIIDDAANFHIVPIDLTRMHRVRAGCFDYIWDVCQEYLLTRRIIIDPFEYVVTSVLDSDDAWHRDTVAIVQQRALEGMPEFYEAERRNMTWIRHTGGMCLTFPDGLRWFPHSDVVVPMHYPFLSMSVFVVARFSSGISACSSRHAQWPSYCNVLNFKKILGEAERPMWVYVRHDRTEVSWDVQDAASEPRCIQLLHENFGIDFEKVQQWRFDPCRTRNPGPAPRSHIGMPGTEQLDCYFRITALNLQIAALEREAVEAGLDAAGSTLLLRQRAARDILTRTFRDQAQTIFR